MEETTCSFLIFELLPCNRQLDFKDKLKFTHTW
jgi:hypothetical protein